MEPNSTTFSLCHLWLHIKNTLLLLELLIYLFPSYHDNYSKSTRTYMKEYFARKNEWKNRRNNTRPFHYKISRIHGD